MKICPQNMYFVTYSSGDLRPIHLFIEVTFLTNSPDQASMGGNFFKIRSAPVPDNPYSILNVLLMTDMTIDILVGPHLPGLPSSLHDVAGPTETRIILNIVIESIATKHDPNTQQDQDHNNNIPKTIHRYPPSEISRPSFAVLKATMHWQLCICPCTRHIVFCFRVDGKRTAKVALSAPITSHEAVASSVPVLFHAGSILNRIARMMNGRIRNPRAISNPSTPAISILYVVSPRKLFENN